MRLNRLEVPYSLHFTCISELAYFLHMTRSSFEFLAVEVWRIKKSNINITEVPLRFHT
jgi:hypothetical protein